MPVVAVGAAIAAIGIAAVDVAAVGIAAIGITEALAITAAVGATIGAVGVVTKNKTLAMVGAGIGVVGAIGGLASAAGVFGSTAATTGALQGATATGETLDAATAAGTGSAFGGAASDASNAATYGATSAFSTGDATGASIAATEAGTGLADPTRIASADIINTWGDLGQDTSLNQVSASTNTTTTEGTPGQVNADVGMPQTVNEAALTDPTPPEPPYGTDASGISEAPPGKPISQDMNKFLFKDAVAPGVNDAAGTYSTSSSSGLAGIGKDILDWAKKPQVSLGLIQAAGSWLKGLTDTLSPAQVNAYNANAANNNAQAGLTNLQAANLTQPKATLTPTALPPVTGAPMPLTPPGSTPPGITATASGGLINRPLTQVGLTA